MASFQHQQQQPQTTERKHPPDYQRQRDHLQHHRPMKSGGSNIALNPEAMLDAMLKSTTAEFSQQMSRHQQHHHTSSTMTPANPNVNSSMTTSNSNGSGFQWNVGGGMPPSATRAALEAAASADRFGRPPDAFAVTWNGFTDASLLSDGGGFADFESHQAELSTLNRTDDEWWKNGWSEAESRDLAVFSTNSAASSGVTSPLSSTIVRHLPDRFYLSPSVMPNEYQKFVRDCCTTAPNSTVVPDTNKVYALLLSSGVARDVLGQIWSLVNRTYPGCLTLPEFFAALTLVAFSQAGQSPHINLLHQSNQFGIPSVRSTFGGATKMSFTSVNSPEIRKKTAVKPLVKQPSVAANILNEPVNAAGADGTTFQPDMVSSLRSMSLEQESPDSSDSSPSNHANSQNPWPATTTASINSSFGSHSQQQQQQQQQHHHPPTSIPCSLDATKPQQPASVSTGFASFPTSSDDNWVDSSSNGAGYTKPDTLSLNGASVNSLELKSVKSDEGAISPADALSSSGRGAVAFGSDGPLRPVRVYDKYAAMKEAMDGLDNNEDVNSSHVGVWTRCLSQCVRIISQACQLLHDVRSNEVRSQVLSTERGLAYLRSVAQIYRVSCRIRVSLKTTTFQSEELTRLIDQVSEQWESLIGLTNGHRCLQSVSSVDLSTALSTGDTNVDNTSEFCGVCLLRAQQPKSIPKNGSADVCPCVSYAGRCYHSACANLWLNECDHVLPQLYLPGLL